MMELWSDEVTFVHKCARNIQPYNCREVVTSKDDPNSKRMPGSAFKGKCHLISGFRYGTSRPTCMTEHYKFIVSHGVPLS